MIILLGPTATGKTTLAAHLADRIDGEIISADSRQVYRRMDIGTGKDLEEYIINGKHIPYHLIDIAEPGERYNLYRFTQDFRQAYDDILSRSHTPILCGGTGLYIEAVLKGYYDTPAEASVFGLAISRDLRRERISQRLDERLNHGMVDEVKALIDSGVSTERLLRYGLEYRYVTLFLLHQLTCQEMHDRLEIAIHQFAKRQMTWFRGMEERRGVPIHWIDATLNLEQKIQLILDQL